MPAQDQTSLMSFFADITTEGLPSGNTGTEKAQPWKQFHEPQSQLLNKGSIVVDIPKTDATGKPDLYTCELRISPWGNCE